jgi:hypothetical protein
MSAHDEPDLFECDCEDWDGDEGQDDDAPSLEEAIEHAGGRIVGRFDSGLKIAIPQPATPFIDAMEEADLELDIKSVYFHPLGDNQPPERLRHHSRYWLYGNFSPSS